MSWRSEGNWLKSSILATKSGRQSIALRNAKRAVTTGASEKLF